MGRTTCIGHGGDPTFSVDLLLPVGMWRPGLSAQAAWPSSGNRTLVQSTHPTRPTHQISRHLRERESTQQIWSNAPAAHSDPHYPDDEHITNCLLIATNRSERHTHVQQVAAGQLVNRLR